MGLALDFSYLGDETLEQGSLSKPVKKKQLPKPKKGAQNHEYPDLPTKYGAPVEKQNQGINNPHVLL